MAEDTSPERSALWAVTTLLVVVLLLTFVYFSGSFGNSDTKKSLIDNNAAPSGTPISK